MKRRTALAAIGALAGGGTSVATVSDDASDEAEPDCDSTAEIVTAKSGDEPIATEEVPEPWYDQVERTRDVQDELGDEFGDEAWFEGTGRSASDEEICGRSRMEVTVYASDEEAAGQQVPETRDGVRIRVEESREIEPDLPTLDDERNGNLDGDVIDGTGDIADSDANASDSTNGNGTDASGDASENGTDGNQTSGDADGMPGPGVLGALASVVGIGYLLAGRRGTEDRS